MYRIESAAPGSSRLHDAAFCQSWNNFTIIGANAGNETLQLITPPLNPTNNKALWNNPSMFFSIAETSPVKKECAEFINWFLNSDENHAQKSPRFGQMCKRCAESVQPLSYIKKERQILRFDVQYLVHLQGLEPWAH